MRTEQNYQELGVQLETLKQQSREAADDTEKEKIKKRMAELESTRERLNKRIQKETE